MIPGNDKPMPEIPRMIKYLLFFLMIVIFTGTGCASAKKARPPDKQEQSLCDLSHLGKNKYYYSNHYQKKLKKSIRRLGSR